MKIYGTTVGTTLPKPSWSQANPKKGDYIKDKPTEMEPVRGYSAYQVACMNGFEGTEAEWLESLKADTEVVVQEIIKEEHMETIVQEIIKEENLQTIVQEILKEENTEIIVEQVMEEIPGHLVVKLDGANASHSAAEINEHIAKGGSVVLDVSGNDWQATYATLWYALPASVVFAEVSVNEGIIYQTLYIINDSKVYTEETKEFKCSGESGGGGEAKKPVKKVTVTKNGTIVNVYFQYTDDTGETALITIDENDTPLTITENGNTTTFEWSGL